MKETKGVSVTSERSFYLNVYVLYVVFTLQNKYMVIFLIKRTPGIFI